MSKPLVVYWCTNAALEKSATFALLDLEPKPVLPDVMRHTVEPPQTYRQCTGLKKGAVNLFYLNYPVDFHLEWTFNNDTQEPVVTGANSDWVLPRWNTYKERLAFDLDLGWLFFAEQPLILKQTPPYAHQTEAVKYGLPAMGALDVGRWFRSVSPAWTLYEGVREFHMPRQEPAMYVEFYTERNIIFKQFLPTERLKSIWWACSQQPLFMPRISLENRYALFSKANMRKMVLKEIRANLLD